MNYNMSANIGNIIKVQTIDNTNNQKCKLINVVWIERGILLTMISFILKKYKTLFEKKIIVENERHRNFLQMLFPLHVFEKFTIHTENNFYFNVRKIIKMQDVVIDYVTNCENILHTKKINLVPWYDMNDMLIYYKIDNTQTLNLNKLLNELKFFSKCTRGNFYGYVWDAYIEANILQKYVSVQKYSKTGNHMNASIVLKIINTFLLQEYTMIPTTIQNIIEYPHPQIYYKTDNVENDNEIKKIKLENDANINDLINLITNKLSVLNTI